MTTPAAPPPGGPSSRLRFCDPDRGQDRGRRRGPQDDGDEARFKDGRARCSWQGEYTWVGEYTFYTITAQMMYLSKVSYPDTAIAHAIASLPL